MTSWINERAEEIRRAEKQKKEELAQKLTVARDLKAQLAPFWQVLVKVLLESVKEFNAEFPEPARQINEVSTPDADTIVVRRTAYPTVSLKVQVNNAGTAATYSISRTQRKGINTTETQTTFTYVVNDG